MFLQWARPLLRATHSNCSRVVLILNCKNMSNLHTTLNTMNLTISNVDIKLQIEVRTEIRWYRLLTYRKSRLSYCYSGRLYRRFEYRWPEMNLQRFRSPGRPRSHALRCTCSYWQVRVMQAERDFSFLITGKYSWRESSARGAKRSFYRPETLPRLVCGAEREPQYRSGLVFVLLSLRTGLQSTRYAAPTHLPWSNKSPVWYIYTARRNALGSRKWKAALVIILILRRLTQTSIQWSPVIERRAHRSRWAFPLERELPDIKMIACRICEMNQV